MSNPSEKQLESALIDAFYHDTEEMIIFIDEHNHIFKMNRAAEKVINLQDNMVGLMKSICNTCLGVTSEYALMECRDCFIKREENNQSFQIFLKDEMGEPKPYSASYVVLKQLKGVKVLTLQNISQQIKTQEILHQKTITQKIMSAQENERKRISRELHDSVIQELLNVSVDIRLLKYKTEEEKEKHLQLMEGTISRLMNDIRNLSLELRPSSLDDLGLVAAFNSHFKQLEKNYGLEVTLDENIGNTRFSSEIETAVYRIAQEAVLNALKYANVVEVNVLIQKDERELTLEISDSGDGFTPGDTPKGSGLGLFGMQERAAIVNGRVEINSQLGKGTFVTLTIPL